MKQIVESFIKLGVGSLLKYRQSRSHNKTEYHIHKQVNIYLDKPQKKIKTTTTRELK